MNFKYYKEWGNIYVKIFKAELLPAIEQCSKSTTLAISNIKKPPLNIRSDGITVISSRVQFFFTPVNYYCYFILDSIYTGRKLFRCLLFFFFIFSSFPTFLFFFFFFLFFLCLRLFFFLFFFFSDFGA